MLKNDVKGIYNLIIVSAEFLPIKKERTNPVRSLGNCGGLEYTPKPLYMPVSRDIYWNFDTVSLIT